MRIFHTLTFFLATTLHLAASAQTIHYDVPVRFSINAADYRLIIDSCVHIVQQRMRIDSVTDGVIILAPGQAVSIFNLDNLIYRCEQDTTRREWGPIIRDHFENLFAAIDAQQHFNPADYDSVRGRLAVRIYSDVTLEKFGGRANLLTRVDLQGTYTVLMFDLPGGFMPVSRAQFANWKKDSAEVFAAALANVDAQPVEKTTRYFPAGDGDSIQISFIANDNYAASYALDLLHNSPELVGPWGCAIAIPTKGLVHLCKIGPQRSMDFVKFIQLTIGYNENLFHDNLLGISNKYFWYYKGVFTPIPVSAGPGGQVKVINPAGLTYLFNHLSGSK